MANGTIEAYEPSPLENQQQTIANFLLDKGLISDNYRAQQLAEKMTFISELIPGFGDVQGLREGKFMMDEGNPMMGGIMMGASMLPFIPGSFLARKAGKLQQTIKQAKFDEQRELRNVGSGDGNAAQEAAERARKKHIKAQRELDEMVAKEKATPNLEPKVTPKAPPKAVQQEFDFNKVNIPNTLFHGSQTKGIKNLELPNNPNLSLSSTGGIFSVADPKDPRFRSFIKGLNSRGDEGSGYVLKSNIKNPLDAENIPEDMLTKLQNMEMYRGRPSRGGPKNLDFNIDTILRNPEIGGGNPIKKDFADIFTREGYDALRYPPRRGMTGEGDTIISLDPSNLEITDEIPYDQLDDFIRTLLND